MMTPEEKVAFFEITIEKERRQNANLGIKLYQISLFLFLVLFLIEVNLFDSIYLVKILHFNFICLSITVLLLRFLCRLIWPLDKNLDIYKNSLKTITREQERFIRYSRRKTEPLIATFFGLLVFYILMRASLLIGVGSLQIIFLMTVFSIILTNHSVTWFCKKMYVISSFSDPEPAREE